MGDANVFLTFDPNWCVDMKAKNAVLPDFKPVHTYAVLGRGLLIYSGFDRDFMQASASGSPGTGAFYLAKIWERELMAAVESLGAALRRGGHAGHHRARARRGHTGRGPGHTVTATVTDVNGTPLRSVFVNCGDGRSHLHPAGHHQRQRRGHVHLHRNGARERRAARAGGGHPIEHRQRALERGADRGRGRTNSSWHRLPGHARRTPVLGPEPGDVLTYSWRQVAGPTVTLDDPTRVQPHFTPTGGRRPRLRAARERRAALRDRHRHRDGGGAQPAAGGQDQSVTTNEDAAAPIVLGASDPDGDTMAFTLLSAPAHGTLTGTAPSLTYTPEANFSGPDGFTFRVADTLVSSNVATVSITVLPMNDAPVANDQSVATDEDAALPILLTASDIEATR